MSAGVGQARRIGLIAGNTFLEAVRQKFFNALLLVALGLVAGARFFQQFDFGTHELKFITDIGFGVLLVFGSILAIVACAQLFFGEIENRTALTLLAKPVGRFDFLAGKLLGVCLLLLAFTVALSLVLAGILYWREAAMGDRGALGSAGGLVRYGDLAVFGLLQWIKFGVLAAITLFVASFSNTNLYTVLVSFIVLVICQLQYIAREAYAGSESFAGWVLAGALGLVFPNFQLFNVGDRMAFEAESALPAMAVARIALYGVIYVGVFLGLAHLNFKRREI